VNTAEINNVVAPASLDTPRKVEGTILPLDGGRLYLVYTAGERANHVDGGMPEGGIQLMGKWSYDEGESWSEKFLVRKMNGIPNVMEPSFVRLPGGRVLQAYMQWDTYQAGEAYTGLRCKMTHSDDDCATWSEPTLITGSETTYFTTNDHLVPLSSGRILLPVLTAPDMTSVRTFVTDDDGRSWRKGETAIRAADGVRYSYPMAVELSGGTVAMFLTNSSGRMHVAHSTDGGDTWSDVNESGLEPCPAPVMVRRVPETGDLLLIWNNHPQRTNLTSAISRDDGNTWTHYRLLQGQQGWPIERTSAYPSLAFSNGYAHMTWYERRSHPKTGAMFDLLYRRRPVSWFYEGPSGSE